MAGWPDVKLGACVHLLAGFPFKSLDFTDTPNDTPLIKGENVSQGRILWDISKRWPAAEWSKMAKFQLRPGDVVVAMDRSLGSRRVEVGIHSRARSKSALGSALRAHTQQRR